MIIIVFHQNKLTRLLLNATPCSFPMDLQVLTEAETSVLQSERGPADVDLVPAGSGDRSRVLPRQGRVPLHHPGLWQTPSRSPWPVPAASPAASGHEICRPCQAFLAPVAFPPWSCPTLAKRWTWHRTPTHR